MWVHESQKSRVYMLHKISFEGIRASWRVNVLITFQQTVLMNTSLNSQCLSHTMKEFIETFYLSPINFGANSDKHAEHLS